LDCGIRTPLIYHKSNGLKTTEAGWDLHPAGFLGKLNLRVKFFQYYGRDPFQVDYNPSGLGY
jgi:hypothetical protein